MPREPIQIALFQHLQALDDRPTQRHRKPNTCSRPLAALQMAFQFVPRPLQSDEDTEFDYPVHRIVKAEDAEPIRPAVARSIFDLGVNVEELQDMARMLTTHGRPGHSAAFRRVQRDDGRQEVIGAMYPAARWTPEREEAERIRRAKQRPPKPPKGAKTRGKKVREWDGEVVG